MTTHGMRKALSASYEEALQRVPEALKTQGFGVLTEIDVQSTLKEKIGADFRRYKILGACNPPLALRALEAELEVGLMLPCNVIVYEDDQGKAVVVAIDPVQTIASTGSPALQAVAAEVKQKLSLALEQLK